MAIYNRYYLSRNQDFPEADLWAEMSGTSCGKPELRLYSRDENGPRALVTLDLPEALRLQSLLSEKFIPYSTQYTKQETVE